MATVAASFVRRNVNDETNHETAHVVEGRTRRTCEETPGCHYLLSAEGSLATLPAFFDVAFDRPPLFDKYESESR